MSLLGLSAVAPGASTLFTGLTLSLYGVPFILLAPFGGKLVLAGKGFARLLVTETLAKASVGDRSGETRLSLPGAERAAARSDATEESQTLDLACAGLECIAVRC